ncbi:hypothetical protein BDV34DRAFT_139386 [Aspergillus parasiticus]|uniref:Secreted protein n=1 Tax=Aspergillus parasiticus TaxID=5067 RepID=A0A5N6DZS6_ASPPA|nr:hypothetical protein BDV34DRAFT_139386 [Aspergillus parasiticus]
MYLFYSWVYSLFCIHVARSTLLCQMKWIHVPREVLSWEDTMSWSCMSDVAIIQGAGCVDLNTRLSCTWWHSNHSCRNALDPTSA